MCFGYLELCLITRISNFTPIRSIPWSTQHFLCIFIFASCAHHMFYCPHRQTFVFPLTHHLFHKLPTRLHLLLLSRRCRSSPSSVSSSWVLKVADVEQIVSQLEWWLSSACLEKADPHALTRNSFIDPNVFLIISDSWRTRSTVVAVASFASHFCPHSQMNIHPHTERALSTMLKLHSSKLRRI